MLAWLVGDGNANFNAWFFEELWSEFGYCMTHDVVWMLVV